MAKKNLNMLSGSLWNKILIFALPLAASSMLQQLFNSADVAVVGRFAGNEALAAVGSNGPIINLLVNIFVGLSIGANVVISRFIGEGNEKKISQAVHTAIVLAFLSGVFVMCAGIALARPILELISTPSDIIDLSTVYLRIYFIGMPFQMLYNFSAAVLRSRGDTKRPLICLTISGVLNVILNLFFVIVLHMGVAGVAISTVISQAASGFMLIILLIKEEGALRLNIKKLGVDSKILKDMARIGIPAGIQGMVFSFSNVCIQSSLNSLGSQVVAASAAALNFEILTYYMLNSFEQAAVTFTGQNYGAGNLKRCAFVTRDCLLLSTICVAALALLFIIFGKYLIVLYTADAAVAAIALKRMKIILIFEIFNSALEVFSGAMRGLGYSFVPALISMAGICGVRLLFVFTVFRMYPTFEVLMSVYPISWIITMFAVGAAYFIVKKKAAVRLGR